MIFFRDQHITPEQHLAFGRLFGDLHVHPAAPHEPGKPELMIIHADKDSPRANGEGWHTDVSCDVEPPMGSILYIKKCPPKGGDTLFASMYAAYEALSDRMKTYLDGLTAIHDGEQVYRGLYANFGVADKPQYPRAEHPVVRTHPVTGKKALYVNRGFTRAPGRRAARRERRASCAISTSTWRTRCSSAASAGARTRSPSGTTAASSTARCGTTGRTRAAATASRSQATSRTDASYGVLVIFDCDGVLVDSEPLANACFSRALKAQGLDWSVEETMRRLMGRSLKSCVEIVEAELGRKLPDDFVEKMQAVTYQSFRDAPLQPVAGVEGGGRGAAGGGHRHLRRKLGRAGEDALHARPHRPVGPVRGPHLQREPGAARQAVSRSLPACGASA